MPPLGPENRALQVQVVLAVTEFEFARHDVHDAFPVVCLYFPVTHPVHATPSGPVYPALHLHALIAPLAPTEFEFSGQFMHVHASFALSYLPALHPTQTLSCWQVFPTRAHVPQQLMHD
jgi:hypothetical protein